MGLLDFLMAQRGGGQNPALGGLAGLGGPRIGLQSLMSQHPDMHGNPGGLRGIHNMLSEARSTDPRQLLGK